MQNWGSLYVYQYFSIHRTSLYVRELRLIILAFNLPFFPFGLTFLDFSERKANLQAAELACCMLSFYWRLGVGILSCKEKTYLVKLDLSDYNTGCLYSLEGMWYASNLDLMTVEMEPITVQAVICLYKLIGFIVY